MIVFAVCDDDTAFAELTADHLRALSAHFSEEIETHVCTFFSASQVLNYIGQNPIHILLLDINMPGFNGFELAESLQKISPTTIIIFVSAYDYYVYDSFLFNPFCFLRKTHLKEELDKTVIRAVRRFFETNDTMIFSTVDGNVNIRIQDIVYIESVKNYYEIHCGKNIVCRCRGTLSSVEPALVRHNFHRVHPAYLVNMQGIRSVNANRNIELIDGTSFYVSLRRWAEFNKAYMEFARKRVLPT